MAAGSLLIAASLGTAPRANAGVYTYSSTPATINCGVLSLDSSGQVNSAGQFTTVDIVPEYPFYILDQRTDIKPAGWVLRNPLAPTTVTHDIVAAYQPPYAFTLGQNITPAMAPYWRVSLPSVATSFAAGADPLRPFNLLIIASNQAMGLSRAEREVLRNYVDEGGTLWIENLGGASTLFSDPDIGGVNTPGGLFVDVQFNPVASGAGNPYAPDTDHRHPLVTTPFFFTNRDILTLGNNDASNIASMSPASNFPDPFSLVSVLSNTANIALPHIAAGDFGAGHIVIDNADILDAINAPVLNASGDTGFCPSATTIAAPTVDLQFMVNVISWSADTASSDEANPRRTGAQATLNPNGGSFGKSWVYPQQVKGGPTVAAIGTAISGNVAYVTAFDKGATPTLHAFDLIPAEDLDLSGNPDNGYAPSGGAVLDPTTGYAYTADWSKGLGYDELWSSVVPSNGALLSAPTVAILPKGTISNEKINQNNYNGSVLVEDAHGVVYIYDAAVSPTISQPTPPVSFITSIVPPNKPTGLLGQIGAPFTASGAYVPVPSPLYYQGWIIAAEPVDATGNASLMLYNLADMTAPAIVYLSLNGSSTADPGPIIAGPAVALVPSKDGNFGGEDLVCYVATQRSVYAVMLGSRDEKLQTAGSYLFTTKLSQLDPAPQSSASAIEYLYGVAGASEDQFSFGGGVPAWTYLNPSPLAGTSLEFRDATASSASGTFGEITLTPEGSDSATTAYGDYDLIPPGYPPTGGNQCTMSRHEIDGEVNGALTGDGAAAVQGIAVGSGSTLYVTVNEGSNTGYIESVREQAPLNTGAGTIVNWRFALTNTSAANDGDNINYPFGSAQFVGAPVVDGSHVYALVYSSGVAYVVCFNPNPLCQILGITQTPVIQQTDENGVVNNITQQQYQYLQSAVGEGAVNLKNFSSVSTSGYDIYPNLEVPSPVSLTFAGSGNGDQTTQASGLYPITTSGNGAPLMAWYASVAIPVGAQLSPLRELGNYLYFGVNQTTGPTTGTAVYYISTQQNASAIGANNQLAASAIQSLPATSIQVGFVTNGLAGSGPYAVLSGTNGIEGLKTSLTLIADNNRLIEIAGDGHADWALDSSTQPNVVGAASSVSAGATTGVTNISLSKPSSITELTPSDILFADTGNSRCVRVDRSGNVLWELTDFIDPSGLLAQGQPMTLNHPSSVVQWVTQASNGNNIYTTEHYLVCDADNYRILEVDDFYTNGTIINPSTDYHILHWVSHTMDQQGREYRYTWADRFVGSTGGYSIVATIANKHIAPLVSDSGTAALDSAAKDGPGSTLVLLDYAPTPTDPTQSPDVPEVGQPWAGIAYATTAQNGFPTFTVSSVKYGTTANPTLLPIRNLHFVSSYLPQGAATPTSYDIVIADDDGVFDGIASPVSGFDYTLDTTGSTGFSFLQTDYQADVVSTLDTELGLSSSYPMYPPAFVPVGVQKLGNQDYLITNGAAVGDARNYYNGATTSLLQENEQTSGGCVFEVTPSKVLDGPVFGRIVTDGLANANNVGPTNTGPLSQPAFATQSQ